MRLLSSLLVLLFVLLGTGAQVYARGVYQEPEAFLQDTFSNAVPKPAMVWVTRTIRPTVEKILGHKPNALRIRYWREQARTAWILEEIGKEKPITVGLVINDDKIEKVKVLIFRESRGWEVKRSDFTKQFTHAKLDSNQKLTQTIDGISGATLSVKAVTKLSRLSLYLHSLVIKSDGK